MAVLHASGPTFLAERFKAESPLSHGATIGMAAHGDAQWPYASIIISLSPWRDWQERLQHLERFVALAHGELERLRSRYQATLVACEFPLHRSLAAQAQTLSLAAGLLVGLGRAGIDLRISYLPPDFSGAENRHPRIVIHPELCGGRPVIRGTRVLVRNLVDCLSRNQALWQIQEDFPDITAEDVSAAVAFISEQALHL